MMTDAEPDFVVSCVDVALTVAVPDAAGVKTPEPSTAPMPVGLTDHVTDVLKLPVPATVAEHADVCVVKMEDGEQATDTEVIAGGKTTVTVAEPDLEESSVDVAVIVADPAPDGVNTPADVTDPPVAVQFTPEL